MGSESGPSESRVYRFADCVLDAAQRELRRNGQQVDVQPKAFDLLLLLLENRHRAVDKDELLAAIWPKVIVTETSLTQAIRRARVAVGDDSDQQRIIGTVHGRGYRFVAPLIAHETIAAGAAPDSAIQLQQPATPPTWRPPALLKSVLWGLLTVIPVAIGYNQWASRGAPPLADTRLAVMPIENLTGDAQLDWTRLGLMSLIVDSLRASSVRVVDDADVVKLTVAQKDVAPGNGAAWVAGNLRRAYGATHLLNGRLERNGSIYRMRVTISDGRDSGDETLFAGTDILQLSNDVAHHVVGRMRPGRRDAADREAISADSFVNEAYARGRAAELEGRCHDAQSLFSVAIAQQPKLLEPKIEYASCARVLGETATAEKILREVLATIASSKDGGTSAAVQLRARAMLELGIVLNRSGRIDEADRVYAAGEALARDVRDEDLVALLLVNRAFIAEDRSEFALARERATRALGLFRDAKRGVIPGSVYGALANIAIDEGRLEEANRYYDLAIESFRSVGDRRNEAMMLNNLGLLRREQGRYADALALHEASGEIRRQIGDRQGLGRVEDMLAEVHLARGRFDLALPATDRALAIAREADDRFFEAVTLGHRGEALAGIHRYQEAAVDLARAQQIFEELGNRAYVLQLGIRLVEVQSRASQGLAAQRRLEAILAAARAQKQDIAEIEVLIALGDLAARRSDWRRSAARYEEAAARARNAGHEGKRTSAAIRLASVHLRSGELNAAGPIIGSLVDAESSYELLRLRAAWAAARADEATAATLMQASRQLAGQRWSDDDAALLERYLTQADRGKAASSGVN